MQLTEKAVRLDVAGLGYADSHGEMCVCVFVCVCVCVDGGKMVLVSK
jgi:hypothetical protein